MAALTVEIKAIVGLGNPGPKYSQTRHNAGFWFVEELARAQAIGFSAEKKFHGETAKLEVAGNNVWLLKPGTFMNASGLSVKSLLSFYRIEPQNILVVHDEIDLPAGEIKIKSGGGHGGHNGLRDIINQLGSKDFLRLRVGVGHPGSKDQVVDYVLQKASKDDKIDIDVAMDSALKVMPDLLSGNLEQAMQSLHSK